MDSSGMDNVLSGLSSKDLAVEIEFPGVKGDSEVAAAVFELLIPSIHQSFRLALNYSHEALRMINGNTQTPYVFLLEGLSISGGDRRIVELSLQTSQRLRMQLKTMRKDIDSYYSQTHAMQHLTSSDELVMQSVEQLDDNILFVERMWHFAEILTFASPINIGLQFMAWLHVSDMIV
jgi:hypothetical protein